MNNVMILGGYGAAGKAIAMKLAKRLTGAITIAGRSMAKAKSCVEELEKEAPVGTEYLAGSVDVTDQNQVIRACEGQQLVVLACDASPASLETLIRACVDNGADYVDIAPDSRKRAVFESLASLIKTGQSRFVLDAGADPGLPGWLARWLSLQSPEPLNRMQLFARFRSNEIGWSGAADMLSASDSQGWVYDGHWRRSSFWDCKWKSFRGGLGRSLCVPVRLDEFDSLPEELGLQTFKCYHAGLNPLTDALMVLEGTALTRSIPFETRQRIFFGALKRLTSRPFGLSIEAVGRGAAGQLVRAAVGHADLYAATAIPAAVMSEFLLNDKSQSPGFGYLGEWASVYPQFLGELREEDFWFENEASH